MNDIDNNRVIVDNDNKYDNFIMDKMREYDPTSYTDEDFKIYCNTPHTNMMYLDKDGNIIVFATILILDKINYMCYTWCSKTRDGIRGYIKGIDYMVKNYQPLKFNTADSQKFNKIKRMV